MFLFYTYRMGHLKIATQLWLDWIPVWIVAGEWKKQKILLPVHSFLFAWFLLCFWSFSFHSGTEYIWIFAESTINLLHKSDTSWKVIYVKWMVHCCIVVAVRNCKAFEAITKLMFLEFFRILPFDFSVWRLLRTYCNYEYVLKSA